jgi:hypothetical protein
MQEAPNHLTLTPLYVARMCSYEPSPAGFSLEPVSERLPGGLH